MSLQTVINFESAVLRPQNNQESEKQVITSCIHFLGQTEWVMRQLMSGRRISGKIARDEFGIEDVRARIHEIRLTGIKVEHSVIPGSNGKREWYLSEEEILRIKKG